MGETRNKGKCSRVELLWPSEHEIAVTGFVIDVHDAMVQHLVSLDVANRSDSRVSFEKSPNKATFPDQNDSVL
jgi:hypothetical protein